MEGVHSKLWDGGWGGVQSFHALLGIQPAPAVWCPHQMLSESYSSKSIIGSISVPSWRLVGGTENSGPLILGVSGDQPILGLYRAAPKFSQ